LSENVFEPIEFYHFLNKQFIAFKKEIFFRSALVALRERYILIDMDYALKLFGFSKSYLMRIIVGLEFDFLKV
jgi:hypothetical protein